MPEDAYHAAASVANAMHFAGPAGPLYSTLRAKGPGADGARRSEREAI